MALEIFKLVTQDNKLVCRGVLHQQQYNECLIHHLHQGKIQSYVDFWQNKKEWKCFLKIRPIFNLQVWHNRLQWTESIFRNVYFGKKGEKTKLGFHFWWSLNDFKVFEIFLERNLTLCELEWFAICFQKSIKQDPKDLSYMFVTQARKASMCQFQGDVQPRKESQAEIERRIYDESTTKIHF